MQQEVEDFLTFCRIERRLAPLTCTAYERDVRTCLAFLRERGISDLGAVKPPDLRAFLADEASHRPAVSSQARTIAALKGFFRFQVEKRVARARDPAAVLRTPKKSEALPDVLDKRELARLLRCVDRDDVWRRLHPGKLERDRLLLAPSLTPGWAARNSSASTSRTWTSGSVCCACGRGRARVVPLHPRSCHSSTTYPSAGSRSRARCSSAFRGGGFRRRCSRTRSATTPKRPGSTCGTPMCRRQLPL